MRLLRLDRDKCNLEDSLQVYIQPIFDIDNFSIVGGEALIRSKATAFEKVTNNSVSALELINKNGWYLELDYFVLKNICEFINLNKHRITKQISVNLCKETIEIEGVADKFIKLIEGYNIDRELIAFEVNEKTNFENKNTSDNLNKLNTFGIEIMLDDFGFGDTSLILISSYNVTTVKLDKIFLNNLTEKRIKAVKGMIEFLTNLDIKIVIEGVENKEQLDIIRGLGKCDVQGYLLGKPVDMETYLKLYAKDL